MTCGSQGSLGRVAVARIRLLPTVLAAMAVVWSVPVSAQQGAPAATGNTPQAGQAGAQPVQGRSSQLDRVFQGLAYRKIDWAAGASGGIDPVASAPGAAPAELIAASPHDGDVRYSAEGRTILRSQDGGLTWTPFSAELGEAGPWEGLTAVAESPVEPGLVWVGAADGRVYLTRDGGASWQTLTLPASAGSGRVRSVEPSSHRGGVAYVTIDGRQAGDARPLVFRTDDYGTDWTLLTDERSGVPADHTITVVREDPEEARLLFAGTPHGVYVSFDGGGSWDLFQFGLPDAFVGDVRIVGRDLVVATEGSGYWVMDEIGPLRQVMEGLTAGEPYLFEPSPTYLDRLSMVELEDVTRGAIFDYLLPSNVRNVRLEVLHAEGAVLATFAGAAMPRGAAPVPGAPTGTAPADPAAMDGRRVPGTRAGVHRIVWDLTVSDEERPGEVSRAVPGTYRLRLIVDGLVRERPFEIVETAGMR